MSPMTKQVDFIFDFASPNAYFAYKVLSADGDIEIAVTPCLLGGIFKATGNQAPMVAFANIKNKLAYDFLEIQRFIKKHGLSRFKMNPHFPVNTLHAMRGLIAAQREGVAAPYIEAVLAAMWEDEKNMSDTDVIRDVLAAAGLDADKLLALSATDEVKTALKENTAAAVERGAFGVPTFFVGEERCFGKERLEQVREALAA